MKEILKYYNAIIHAHSEEAKKLLFFNLLMELFKKNDEIKDIISKMSLGAETTILNIPINKDKTKTGRADTQYGKVIIEFEKDLSKTLKHAEEQLKEYLLGNWCITNDYNYTLISTDGLKWAIYGVKPESFLDKTNVTVQELELKVIDWFVLDDTKSLEFFTFLDRYLFRYETQTATLENIQIDFGESSGLFLTVIGELRNFYNKIAEEIDIKTAYNEWATFLSIAYGSFNANPDIFLVHTYLSVFSKLLAYSVITHDKFIDDDELKEILEGTKFRSLQVANFVENDFYKWISNPKYFQEIKPTLRRIAAKIGDYDLSNIKSDILKGVYQELIDLETRHSLGEYYTPDWLCEKIVNSFDFERSANIFDPSCGSGSFLLAAVTRMKKLHSDITLEELSSQIVGIDIHPLSVQIAKTTLLLSFGSLLKNIKKPFYIRVYLSNSIVAPDTNVNLFGEEFVVKMNNKTYYLPKGTFDFPTLFDFAISFIEKLATITLNKSPEPISTIENILKKETPNIDKKFVERIYDIYLGLKEAKETGNDSIWSYILQNSYKPFFLKHQFDYIVGNPPWITFRNIKNVTYQEELKKLASKYKIVPDKVANLPNLEIAAIFLAHCNSYFLKPNGKLAFVLPRSFISAEHHDNSRSGKAEHFIITSVWDLENVSPLFNIPSCVWFTQHAKEAKSIPENGIKGLSINGKLKQHNNQLSEIIDKLTDKNVTWYYSKLNKVSALSNTKINISSENPYKKYFKAGATIIPRNFYFVQLECDKPSDWKDRVLPARSNMQVNEDAKKPWKDLILKGEINTNYLFYTAISKNIIPFGILNPLLVVLPIEIDKGKNIKLMDFKKIRELGDIDTSIWFEKVEELWNSNKTDHNSKMKSIQYLNWQNKLTNIYNTSENAKFSNSKNLNQKGTKSQDLSKRYLVLYTASAKDASAVIVDRKQFDLPFIAETKTYVLYADNKDEAYYITAFLNSDYANLVIKDFQSKGLFGPRDIHKKILDVPFSKYNSKNSKHLQIVELSKECEKIVSNYIKDNQLNDNDYNVGQIRSKIRKLLANKLVDIDKLIK